MGQPPRDAMSHDDMMAMIAEADTTMFVRLRSDGHPVGAVVGSGSGCSPSERMPRPSSHRRLFRIVPEKFFSSDQRTLPRA
jgi:hypothetical protein